MRTVMLLRKVKNWINHRKKKNRRLKKTMTIITMSMNRHLSSLTANCYSSSHSLFHLLSAMGLSRQTLSL